MAVGATRVVDAAGAVSDAGAAVSGVSLDAPGAGASPPWAGGSPGVAVTGCATVDVAVLGRAAESDVNGGVAVEGTGIAGLPGAKFSCEVTTFAEPGGTAGGGSAHGSSCATFRGGGAAR